jgi:regulation of enolase protein 1 (concanavalin A-like superfamily)
MLPRYCMPAIPTAAHPPHESPTLNLPASSPLQACPHCEALIDTTERDPLETVACPGCGAPLQMNGQIAGLQLVEVAGRGGMGVVYKAYDPGLDRLIAIKLLRKDHSTNQRFLEQLENEATITASINDPNVVRVYATGFDRGRFFLAMELVDKGSLDDLIRLQGRVAEPQVLEIGIQIASGLRAAFQHGLIHRDIKPGNILFGDGRIAKIVDFGLAMFANQIEESTGEVWGTPYYVPPEKLDGGIEDLRSDIYSLGATLFHALAGRPPFEAENASLVALKHVKSQAVSLQSFAPWVSNPTAHIINRTLAKNPADRFQSYDDFIHNLQYALDQLQQSGGTSPSRARVVLETDEDRKTWTWVVLGMAAVIVVLIGVFAFMRPKSQDTVAPAKIPAKPTVTPIESSGLKAELLALASREEKSASLMEAAAARSGAPANERAWAQLLAGAAHLSAGRGDQALDAFKKVGALASAVRDPEIATFFKTVSARLARRDQIPLAETESLGQENHEAAGYLLYGLQNWQSGALDDGAAMLRQFRACKITGSTAWLMDLRPFASSFVERFVTYQMAVNEFKRASNSRDRATTAKTLRDLGPAFAKRVESIIAPFEKEIAAYNASLTGLPKPALYRIFNKNSNLTLDVEGYGRQQGAKIRQWAAGGGTNQTWELVSVSGDTFKLRAVHSGLVLNLPNSATQPGTKLWQWKDDGTPAGLWRLEPQGDGWFFIRSASSNQVLAVDGMSTSNGGSITQWDKPGSADHFWRFERVGTRIGEWYAADLGNAKGPAYTKIKDNTLSFEVNNFDIWNKSDSCRYVFRDVAGDFDFIAQLTEMTDITDWTKVGIMVRSTLLPSSRNFLFGISGRRGVIQQRRPANNVDTTQEKAREDLKGPGWIKLTRRGSVLTGFHSRDGKTWTQVCREQLDFIHDVMVGLAASSWGAGKTFNVRFENVSLTQP